MSTKELSEGYMGIHGSGSGSPTNESINDEGFNHGIGEGISREGI